MTDPRPVDMLLRGYGVDDVQIATGLSYLTIATRISMSPHREMLEPYRRIAMRRAQPEPAEEATPHQKPEKPERGTAAAKAHMSLVSQLRCICCLAPSEVLHHAIHGRFAQRKASDMDVLPMCVRHHELLHGHPAAWRAAYGADADYLPKVREAVDRLRANTIGGR